MTVFIPTIDTLYRLRAPFTFNTLNSGEYYRAMSERNGGRRTEATGPDGRVYNTYECTLPMGCWLRFMNYFPWQNLARVAGFKKDNPHLAYTIGTLYIHYDQLLAMDIEPALRIT